VVEPTSLALLACQRAADRSGATWTALLKPFVDLRSVISDAAKGIAAGVVAAALAQGRGVNGRPPLDQGLDVFHTGQEANRTLRRPWRIAIAASDAAAAAAAKVADAKRAGRDARAVAAPARVAREHAEACLAELERQHAAWQRARAALALFRPDGTLNDRDYAEGEIQAAVVELTGPDWQKVRNALTDRRALTFLDYMHERLRTAVPDDALRDACVRRWSLRHHRPKATTPTAASSIDEVLDEVIRNGPLNAAEQAAYDQVGHIIRTTIRASSAVEGINSVLRMHQGRHRTMTQGMLDLKRLYWNCRRPMSGRRKGKSPYELLGVALPSTDFWTLLAHSPRPTETLSN
jgi:hypothetical protein